MRDIYAKIEVDDDLAISENVGTLDYLEMASAPLKSKGVNILNAVIADEESTEDWEEYIAYVFNWALDHALDYDKKPTIASYKEWRNQNDR